MHEKTRKLKGSPRNTWKHTEMQPGALYTLTHPIIGSALCYNYSLTHHFETCILKTVILQNGCEFGSKELFCWIGPMWTSKEPLMTISPKFLHCVAHVGL